MKEDAPLVPEVNPPPTRPRARWTPGGRKRLAAVSDFLSAWLTFVPPVQWTIDFITALLLFLILGRQWAILPGLIAEAIPGVAIFPVWVLVVGSIAAWGTINPSGAPK